MGKQQIDSTAIVKREDLDRKRQVKKQIFEKRGESTAADEDQLAAARHEIEAPHHGRRVTGDVEHDRRQLSATVLELSLGLRSLGRCGEAERMLH